MKISIRGLCAFLVFLSLEQSAHAQAGRFIPPIRVPTGGFRMPITPFPNLGIGGDILVIVLFVGLLVGLGFAGWYLGRFIGHVPGNRRLWANIGFSSPKRTKRADSAHDWFRSATPTPRTNSFEERDLILNPFDVETKARKTTRLLEFLAYQDRLLNPNSLRQWITAVFYRIQECWQQRDYTAVEEDLMPRLLAKHKGLLKKMRRQREVNKLVGLAVERLDLVHVHCPEASDQHKVTALITFRAASYYVDDRTNEYRRGSKERRLFQEFWVFHRQVENWRLQAIERTHESNRLRAENRVEGLTEEQLQNAQQAVVL